MSLRKTQFTPTRHGFHFSNRFIDKTFSITFPPLNIPGLLPFPGKTVTKTFGGRCAGMSYAALDYFWNQSTVPTHTKDDFGTDNEVPNLNNGLGQYIDSRHNTWNSPDPSNDGKIARIILLPRSDLLSPPDLLPPYNKHVIARGSYNFTLDELKEIRAQINQGNPVPVALVADQTIEAVSGGNHAVVAYGYDDTNNDLYVYDCNFPDRECYIRSNDGDKCFDTYSNESDGWKKRYSWKGYIRKGYPRATPAYFDLTVVQGIKCKNSSGSVVNTISTGETVTAEYKVANKGQYTARLRHYYFSVLKVNYAGDENGVSEDNRLGVLDTDSSPVNDITLDPGQEYLVSKTSTVFNQEGFYRIAASYRTTQGDLAWGFRTLPAESAKTWIQVANIQYTWITAALTPDGRTELFGRGSDNGIYHKWQQVGGGWHAPDALTGIIYDSCLSAANFSDGRLLITHRGTDNKLYYRILSSNGWNAGWICLEGDLSGRPMLLITRPYGKIRIIAPFNNGTLQYRDETTGGWTNWALFGEKTA